MLAFALKHSRTVLEICLIVVVCSLAWLQRTKTNHPIRHIQLRYTCRLKRFQSGIQSLRGHGLPGKIDRSVWLSKSGADQAALLGAFRFLGLIDSKNEVQPTLRKLVDVSEASTAEKEVLNGILRTSYANLFKLNLETVTPTQFAGAIGTYGPTGSTRDRAERFFVKAANYCGIKMSGRLTARKPRGTGTKTNGTKAQRKTLRKTEDKTHTPTQDDQAAVVMKVIDLHHAGGSLTLSGTFNAFELVGDERGVGLQHHRRYEGVRVQNRGGLMRRDQGPW